MLTYEILVGFTPFPGGPPPLDEGLSTGRRLPAFPSGVSADARAFVTACLADAAVDRPTIYELLKHRWVHGTVLSTAAAAAAATAAAAAGGGGGVGGTGGGGTTARWWVIGRGVNNIPKGGVGKKIPQEISSRPTT